MSEELEEHDGRMDVQYFYFGGPRDGKPFEMGPGALIPGTVELTGGNGHYVVNVELRRFEWRSYNVDAE